MINPPGPYEYTNDLLALDGARRRELGSVDPELRGIHSPLSDRLPRWEQALAGHPDSAFAHYVLSGLRAGFRVGFEHSSPLAAAGRNMHTARCHPEVIDGYISKEVSAGRICGPLSPGVASSLQINRMGVIPKGHTPGKWRLITDLSYPDGRSVNDGIDRQRCSLAYISVETLAAAAHRLGRGALIAKMDIKAAYRLVPVHPEDRYLLGVEWKGAHYADGSLPFGLRSAPKIFTAVADALEWIMWQRGVTWVAHYLDDFATVGPPRSEICSHNLQTMHSVCGELGVPLAEDKVEGPATCLVFLGIEVDTQAGVLRLPVEKLSRIREALAWWSARKTCRRKELESLLGTLQHACRVVKPGRAFLRRMIDLLRLPGATKGHHHIRLNCQFRADIQWWKTFAGHWNGVSMFPCLGQPAFTVTSDASGNWGCGAWSGSSWFQFEWPQSAKNHHISFKEMFAGLLSCAAWGKGWRGARVEWRCDNQAAVQAIASRSCRDQPMMHLIRCLFFLEAWFGFELVAVHLPGEENSLADDLSRNRRSLFLSKARSPDPLPTELRPALPRLLLGRADWTSPRWTEQFASIVTGD